MWGTVPSSMMNSDLEGALSILRFGGRDGIRTHDLLIANSGENKLRQGATIT